GRETIVAARGEQHPTISGDASAHMELAQMPEAELVHPVLDALATTDVPEAMYRGQANTAARYQGLTVYCGQVAYLPTYSIWWSSTFVRYDLHSTIWGWIQVQDFWAGWVEALQPGTYY